MHSFFKDPKTVERMQEGPLGPYVAAYAAQLHAAGYARQSGCGQIRLVAGFSRWLSQKGLSAREVEPRHTAEYLRFREQVGYRPKGEDPAALARLLKLLREQGVIREPVPPGAGSPSERLLEKFDLHLRKERGLAPATRVAYRWFAGRFLSTRFGSGPVVLASLCAADITGFVRRQAPHCQGKRVHLMTTALRSFLRFARYRGDLTSDLAACVPSVASWSLSALPSPLSPAQVEQVLAHCDRQRPVGRRDYAILLLLARLGLRAGEVVRLTLEDIDWENGSFTVQGKAGRCSQLPLPADVGEAMADYLEHGRPLGSGSRRVFLCARAPIAGLKGQQTVGSVVRRALARAGIDSPRKGAHQFRHTLATELLRRGASLAEIGEVLRHQTLRSAAIYAKVDLAALRGLALPWPGGAR